MVTITQSARCKPIRLLFVVDECKTHVESLVASLQEADPERYSAEWTGAFEDGDAAIQRGEYDIVLIEQHVNRRDGINLVRKAAANGIAQPIILLTDTEELEESMPSAGVVDCLCKQKLDVVRLEYSIRGAIRHAQALASMRERHKRLRQEIKIARKREGQLLTAITENMPIVVGRLDNDGCVIEANGSELGSQGMAPANLLGRQFVQLYPSTSEAIEQAFMGRAATCEIRGRNGDKEWYVEFFAFPDASRTGAIVFIGRDITIKKTLESRLISISDAEQRRIGADLHDDLGQHLTGTACMAAALCEKLKTDHSPHAAQAASIVALTNAAVDLTRGLARGLCPVQIEVGSLCSALEDFSYQVQRLHRVKCRFRPTGPQLHLEQITALHLYRIVQEAVNNVLRHGAASDILITLDRAFLAVEDNGRGFDPSTLSDNRRLGLRLMNYRASIVGGSLKISRRATGGMRVECIFSQPFS